MAADRCGFCGSLDGPFTPVEGLFTEPICPACLAARARGRGPYPNLTDEEMHAGLDQLPTGALEQKAAANRQVIAVMRQRLEHGERVAPMYGPLGLAWLQRRADIATGHPRPRPITSGHTAICGSHRSCDLLAWSAPASPAPRAPPGRPER
jgi:hypothetical protein